MSVQPRPGHGSDQRDEQKKENEYQGSQSASIIMAHDGGGVGDRAACGGNGRLMSKTAVFMTVITQRVEPTRDMRSMTPQHIDGDHAHGWRDVTRRGPMMQPAGCIAHNTSVDAADVVAARSQPEPQALWLAGPLSPTCSTLSPSWGLSEAAPRARLVRDRGVIMRHRSLPSTDYLSHLLPVSGRAGARASTVLLTWRSRAFGGGALRQRPTGRISQRRR